MFTFLKRLIISSRSIPFDDLLIILNGTHSFRYQIFGVQSNYNCNGSICIALNLNNIAQIIIYAQILYLLSGFEMDDIQGFWQVRIFKMRYDSQISN